MRSKPPKLTTEEAFARAVSHRARARQLRTEGANLIARAERYERWATLWSNWADDEYGEVPYPDNAR